MRLRSFFVKNNISKQQQIQEAIIAAIDGDDWDLSNNGVW